MAKDKKSFLVYCDLLHTVKKMKKEDVGELFLHILEYTNDLNPTTDNIIVELVFEPIKQQLKRDLKSYEKSLEDKSLNGRLGNLKRWNNDLFLQYESKLITLEEAEQIAKSRKISQPDSIAINNIAKIAVTDTDNVKVKDIKINNIEERTQVFKDECKTFISTYGTDLVKSFFLYWSEPNKTKTKMKYELQNTWELSRRLATWSKNESNFKKPEVNKLKSNLGV